MKLNKNHPKFLDKDLFRVYKIHKLLLAELVLIFTASVITPIFESGYQSAQIKNFSDSLWWALVTITSTGYGDFVPVSFGGKLIGTILMFSGFALYSISVGVFVLFIYRHRSKRNWQRTQIMLDVLHKKINRLEKQQNFLIKFNFKKK